MAYVGNTPAAAYTSLDKQVITGNGGAAYTLDHSVANENEIEVFVNNVRQEPSVAYTVSGTALTMTGDVAASDDFYVVFQGKAIQTTSHPEGQDLKARDGTFSGKVTADGVHSEYNGVSDNIDTTPTASGVQIGSFTNGYSAVEIAGTSGGFIDFSSADGTDYDGRIIYGHSDDSMKFYTSTSERMRVDSSGNVGINETAPETLLHITDNTADDGPVIQLEGSGQNAANNLLGGINFKNNDTSGDGPTITGAIRHYSGSSTGAAGYFTFHTHDGSEGGEGSDAVERMRIDSSGNVIVGKTSTAAMTAGSHFSQNGLLFISRDNDTNLLLNRFGGNGFVAQFRRDNSNVGGISVTTSATSYVTSSDHRLKENAVDMTGAITRVKSLQPKRFNFIADTTDTLVDGFMAHEAATVVPEAVTGTHNEVDADGNAVYQGIDQAKLVPLLTCALQEAIAKIEALETRVQALEDA